jgi:hypothetical protein
VCGTAQAGVTNTHSSAPAKGRKGWGNRRFKKSKVELLMLTKGDLLIANVSVSDENHSSAEKHVHRVIE